MMKILVATNESQGSVEGDYHWAVEGELVYVQDVVCANADCGCGRGFAGMASSRATTTAMVVDRPGFTEADLESALFDSLTRGGWLSGLSSSEAEGEVGGILLDLEFLTGPAEPGTIIRRQAFEDRNEFTHHRSGE